MFMARVPCRQNFLLASCGYSQFFTDSCPHLPVWHCLPPALHAVHDAESFILTTVASPPSWNTIKSSVNPLYCFVGCTPLDYISLTVRRETIKAMLLVNVFTPIANESIRKWANSPKLKRLLGWRCCGWDMFGLWVLMTHRRSVVKKNMCQPW